MRIRSNHDGRTAAFQHPPDLAYISTMRTQLDSCWQSNRDQTGILTGKEEAVKHGLGLGDDANPCTTFTTQAKQTPRDDLSLVT